MPASRFMVVEAIPSDPSQRDPLREWMGERIRTGDGIYEEEGRLFLVLPSVNVAGTVAMISRLEPEAIDHGGALKFHPFGEDELADSIYRRAEAEILPAEPRTAEEGLDRS